jgi:peptidoglycan-N-acetylglucosamine deacetylase
LPADAQKPAEAAKPAGDVPKATGDTRVTISQCHVEGPYAAITFDDGPHGGQTPRLLKMLRDRGIHSTFFLVGQCVAESPEVARQIVAEGHEIANHSWSHPLLSKMAEGSVRDQIQRTHDVIRQETGVNVTLFRPPFGGFTTNQRAWAHATWGYQIILWDVDSLDWKHRSPAKTQAIILSDARPGSIILCHDIHKTTVDAMPATLDGLLAKGLKLVTVSELLKMHKESANTRRAAAVARPLTPAEGASAATTLSEVQNAAPIKSGTKP